MCGFGSGTAPGVVTVSRVGTALSLGDSLSHGGIGGFRLGIEAGKEEPLTPFPEVFSPLCHSPGAARGGGAGSQCHHLLRVGFPPGAFPGNSGVWRALPPWQPGWECCRKSCGSILQDEGEAGTLSSPSWQLGDPKSSKSLRGQAGVCPLNPPCYPGVPSMP